MARIKAFGFKWTDAWHQTDEGFDSIIETSDSGRISILFLVNGKPFKLDLTDKEDEFIGDMCFLKGWDKKSYSNCDVVDGTIWSLHYTYDDTVVVSKGSNAFPADFLTFLDLLGQKYRIPKCKLENEENIKYLIKHTKITNDPDIDKWAMCF